MGRIAADLSDSFEHDHAGHQRHSGHMAADPELVIRDVFVAHAGHVFGVFVDDRRQLLHFEALGIEFPDLVDIGHNPIEIDRVGVHDELFTYHTVCPTLYAPRWPSLFSEKSVMQPLKIGVQEAQIRSVGRENALQPKN